MGYSRTREDGWYDLKFKVEPVGYDYMFDESENLGNMVMLVGIFEFL